MKKVKGARLVQLSAQQMLRSEHRAFLRLSFVSGLLLSAACGSTENLQNDVGTIDSGDNLADSGVTTDLGVSADAGMPGEDTGTVDMGFQFLQNPQTGDPQLGSADRLAFGPQGVLLIGDGPKDRILAVATEDNDPTNSPRYLVPRIRNISLKIRDIFGPGNGQIEVTDIAVHPISHRIYISLARVETNESAVVKVEPDGKFSRLELESLSWGEIKVPKMGAVGTVFRDLVWKDNTLIASTVEDSWSPSRVFTMQGPINESSSGALTQTHSYHRSHRRWETEAPIDAMLAFEFNGKPHLAATYSCAPIVRFSVEGLMQGEARTTGETPFDLGPGKQVLEMIEYEKDGKGYMLIVYWFLRPSEIYALQVDREYLTQTENLDVSAPVFFPMQRPENPPQGVRRVEDFDGAARIVKIDEQRALVAANNSIFVAQLPGDE